MKDLDESKRYNYTVLRALDYMMNLQIIVKVLKDFQIFRSMLYFSRLTNNKMGIVTEKPFAQSL
jgi:hypothetical protein